MAFRFFIILLLFISSKAFAQTTDTLPQTKVALDSPVIDAPPAIRIDTTAAIHTTKKVSSGYTIHGKIVDMNTNEGIPFAIVSFPRTPTGTTADIDGNFIFKVDKLPLDTLSLTALGYKTVYKVLKKNVYDYNFIIELERAVTSLKEVSIKAGEDPAVLLMRRIIERKPYNNPERLANYRYEAYNRLEADLQRMTRAQFEKIPVLKNYSFIFDNLDTASEATPYLPLYLTETISDYYYRTKPKAQKEFIKASQITGVNNDNVIQYLGSLHQDVNIYDNYVPVFDKKFISPISDDGLFYYKYKIKDTQIAYGHKIIMVQFQPKRKGENCFAGDFWVVDSVMAIQRMSMDVANDVNINWLGKVSVYQEFAPLDSIWFRSKDKFVANFTFYNSKKFPGMIGRKTTTYHHISVNDPAVDSVLDIKKYKKDVILADSVRKSADWWLNNRPDSLSKSEQTINRMADSINTMHITQFYKNLINFLASGVKDFGPIQLGPYFYLYSYNTIEGHRFRVSAGTPRSLKNMKFSGYLAYGTRDERFKYGGTGLWIIGREPYTSFDVTYAHDVVQKTTYYDQISSGNLFGTFLRKDDIPWKLAFADDIKAGLYKEYFNGLSHKLVAHYRDFDPYEPLPSTTIFTTRDGAPARNVVSSEVGLELSYSYKQQYLEGLYKRKRLSTPYPVFNLELIAGLKDVLNSGYEYQKARFSVTEDLNIPPIGHLYVNGFAGKYFSKAPLPYPLLEIHPGNEFRYYNAFAFQMMNNYEFISDEYAGLNIEHNIGGGIFNYIPFIKKLKLRQFWTAKGIIGSLGAQNRQLNFDKGFAFRSLDGQPYLELGTGITNILQVLRVDFVWRVTPRPLPSEQKSRYFGIFGSMEFDF
jgi:hypothetical protein